MTNSNPSNSKSSNTCPDYEKLTVSVTQDDIQFGKKGNCDWCPVAHAVRRVVSEKYIKISVGKRWLVLWPNDVIISREVELPEVAKTFIKEFDRGLPVSPFTFEIDIP